MVVWDGGDGAGGGGVLCVLDGSVHILTGGWGLGACWAFCRGSWCLLVMACSEVTEDKSTRHGWVFRRSKSSR